MDLDQIWSDFDQSSLANREITNTLNGQNNTISNTINNMVCSECKSYNIYNENDNSICSECGLVITEYNLSSQPVYDSQMYTNQSSSSKTTFSNNKLKKMQEWYMWTNEEKNIYKLKMYTRELCVKLQISETIIPSITDTVTFVMDIIKKNEGTKRARVKDGIIVFCIHYVSKDSHIQYSYIDLSKKLSLDIKYVTKAERIILELINSKKLNLNKKLVLQIKQPLEYVLDTINKKSLKVSDEIVSNVKLLIEICEDNDLLLDHTPLSIGVCCFYYVLKNKNITIDLKMFSELYDLSIVTVIKTYNKLKMYEKQISNYGI